MMSEVKLRLDVDSIFQLGICVCLIYDPVDALEFISRQLASDSGHYKPVAGDARMAVGVTKLDTKGVDSDLVISEADNQLLDCLSSAVAC